MGCVGSKSRIVSILKDKEKDRGKHDRELKENNIKVSDLSSIQILPKSTILTDV
jgi:hypothetical protein